MRSKSILWPTIAMLAGLSVLIGLGTWQLQRRDWKLELISRIEARVHADPVPLEQALAAWRRDGDVEYLHVRLEGTFLNDHEIYLQAVENGVAGWNVYVPFATGFRHVIFAPKTVMVNRGFVPDELRDPAKRREGLIEGPVSITGLVRLPPAERGAFVPENDVAANAWYWRDMKAMIAAGPARNRERAPYLPFFVDLDRLPVPGGWPRGGATRLELPNRHLEYALTWYGLALALVGVYAVFIRSRLREGGRVAAAG
ncbi:MAG: SURF1 family protein [Hyphomicrobiaceae bacterium]